MQRKIHGKFHEILILIKKHNHAISLAISSFIQVVLDRAHEELNDTKFLNQLMISSAGTF